MGAVFSTNVAKTNVDVISNVLSSVVSNNISNSTNSQIISVTDVVGNVDIEGNSLSSTVEVKNSALLSSLQDTTIQDKLTFELGEAAKAMLKDIAIGEVSTATNIASSTLSETINITTNLTNTCQSSVTESQSIVVNKVNGNVVVNNNHLTELLGQVNECITNAIGNSKATQSLQSTLELASTASLQGVSIWGIASILGFLVLGAAVVLIGPEVVPIIAAGKNPILLAAFALVISAVFFIIYFAWTSTNFTSTCFSKLYADECKPVEEIKRVNVSTADEAGRIAHAESKCVAYDFVKYTKEGASGTQPSSSTPEEWQVLDQPYCVLYSKVGACPVLQDTKPMLYYRKIWVGSTFPPRNSFEAGMIYIDTMKGEYAVLDTLADYSSPRMQSLSVKGAFKFTNKNYPRTPHIQPTTTFSLPPTRELKLDKGNIILDTDLLAKALFIAPDSNVTGKQIKVRKSWALYTGIGFGALGLLFFLFLGGKKAYSALKKKPVASANEASTSDASTSEETKSEARTETE